MGSSQKRRRPQWTARAELGLSGWAAVELEHSRPPLSMGGCGLGRGAGSTQACARGPGRLQGASQQMQEAGQAREAAPPQVSRGGGGDQVDGRRGPWGQLCMDVGMGWGCPTCTEVTEGAGGIVTRKEPIETDSFLHFRKLSRATLRMSWNGEAKPYSGRPVGGCCGRFKPEGRRWQQQADRVPWVSWKESQVNGCAGSPEA